MKQSATQQRGVYAAWTGVRRGTNNMHVWTDDDDATDNKAVDMAVGTTRGRRA